MKVLTKKELEASGVKFITLDSGRLCGYKMKECKLDHEIYCSAMSFETLRKKLTKKLEK